MSERRPNEARRRLTLELSLGRIAHIDALKKEWGLRNRGDVLERLLDTIFRDEEEDEDDDDLEQEAAAEAEAGDARDTQADAPPDAAVVLQRSLPLEGDFDDGTALVLIGRGPLDHLEASLEVESEAPPPPSPPRAGGIDLPGFVRRRSDRLRSSLSSSRAGAPTAPPSAVVPQLSEELVRQALDVAREHWIGLYGNPAGETVLEAAMIWLAKDIWPPSDQSEGRPFTWSLASRAMREWVSGWEDAAPSFERVMVVAGVLEDPYSAATLSLRIPTLIRRFVHRFRRRRSGSSFQTLEHTMTLQGALRLLQLPADPGQRVTLGQIREAYRVMALTHHPDSGGSVEAMRRLNEAYQLLKELYRKRDRQG